MFSVSGAPWLPETATDTACSVYRYDTCAVPPLDIEGGAQGGNGPVAGGDNEGPGRISGDFEKRLALMQGNVASVTAEGHGQCGGTAEFHL